MLVPSIMEDIICDQIVFALHARQNNVAIELLQYTAHNPKNLLYLLHIASEFQYIEILTPLLNYHIDIDAVDTFNQTALLIASKRKNIKIIELLIKAGANPNILDSNKTSPLHYIVQTNNPDLVRLLLQHGAKVNVKNNYGRLPLYYAVLAGNMEIIAILLEEKADPDIFSESYAEPLFTAPNFATNLKILINSGTNINNYGIGRIPLSIAASRGLNDIINILLDAGANINAQGLYGYTALHEAICYNHIDTAIILLSRGADPNIANEDGYTLLLYPGINDKLTKYLIDAGVNVNIKNKSETTPLHIAIQDYTDDTVMKISTLIAAGANINAQNKLGSTPLHWAIEESNPHIVRVLMDHGADFSIPNKAGITPQNMLESEKYSNLRKALSMP